MRHLRYIHFILFAIIAFILTAGPAWTQSDSSPPRAKKIIKINKNTCAAVMNEFDRDPTPEQMREIREKLNLEVGQNPGANEIIFYHSPNPGTCVWVGYWRCY